MRPWFDPNAAALVPPTLFLRLQDPQTVANTDGFGDVLQPVDSQPLDIGPKRDKVLMPWLWTCERWSIAAYSCHACPVLAAGNWMAYALVGGHACCVVLACL